MAKPRISYAFKGFDSYTEYLEDKRKKEKEAAKNQTGLLNVFSGLFKQQIIKDT